MVRRSRSAHPQLISAKACTESYSFNIFTEGREQIADTSVDNSPTEKDFDILQEGANDVIGLPWL